MKQRRRYGGYLIHLGIVCAFLALAGNALKIERDVSVMKGEDFVVGDYTLRYNELTAVSHTDKDLIVANVNAYRNGELVWRMTPGKAIFHSAPNMPTSEIDIKSTVLEDLYIALVNYDASGNQVAFKVFVAPFTWWFWFGGVILVFGTMIAMWPTREGVESLGWSWIGMLKNMAAAAACVFCFSPLILLAVETYTPWGSAARFIEVPATLAEAADQEEQP